MQTLPLSITEHILVKFLYMQEFASLAVAQKRIYPLYKQTLSGHAYKLNYLLKHANNCEERKGKEMMSGRCSCTGKQICKCGEPVYFVPYFLTAYGHTNVFVVKDTMLSRTACHCHQEGGIVVFSHPSIEILASISPTLSQFEQFLKLLEIVKTRLLRVAHPLDDKYTRGVLSWLDYMLLALFFPNPIIREIRYPKRSRKRPCR